MSSRMQPATVDGEEGQGRGPRGLRERARPLVSVPTPSKGLAERRALRFLPPLFRTRLPPGRVSLEAPGPGPGGVDWKGTNLSSGGSTLSVGSS